MTFASLGLHESLLAAVQRQGYTEPTPIQTATIPTILSGRDVIGLAQTGTGKTAAFVLPIIQRLRQGKSGGIRALIVAPTRELAEQIHTTVVALSANSGLRSATVYGGVGMIPQERALRAGVDIIVACPGRLLDHMDRGYVRLNGVETLVLDEADRMLDMGFMPAIKRIMAHLPARRQTLLFSATLMPEMQSLATNATRDAATIKVSPAVPPTTVAHAIYPVVEQQKTALLLELLHQAAATSVLIFTRTKHRANKVAIQLERAGYATARLHSNRSQNQRQIALDGFRDGTYKVLVATDIAARGIDVTGISHVINYDIPDTPEAYIHRIGRTGRAARSGAAFTLVTAEDTAMVRIIERVLGKPIERKVVSGFDVQAASASVSSAAPVREQYRSAPRRDDRRDTSRVPSRAQPASANGRDQSARPAQRSTSSAGELPPRNQRRYNDAA